ncbi:MAG: cupredoxin family copper-binding protein [Chloroflexi bacterium]|nr:cupredoxin family copper-binding protein [Chloroflexota bacterium]
MSGASPRPIPGKISKGGEAPFGFSYWIPLFDSPVVQRSSRRAAGRSYATLGRRHSEGAVRIPGLLAVILAAAVTAALQSAAAQGEARSVDIVDFGFRPAELAIPAGATVEWVNTGNAPHTATSDTGVWDSGVLASRAFGGGRFRFTFTEPGTYPYHCAVHPSMGGTIVVEGPAATPTPTATAVPSPSPTPSPTATPLPGPPAVARIYLPAVFRAAQR